MIAGRGGREYTMPVFSIPSTHPVREIQTYLREISFVYDSIPRLIPDGIFGPETTQAVIAFQRQFGLTPDGVVNAATWDMLITVYTQVISDRADPMSVAVFPSPQHVLRTGNQHDAVFVLQIMLNTLAAIFQNFNAIPITGEMDQATSVEVRQFQTLYDLESTGEVNRQTWDAIVRAYTVHRT